MFNKKIIFTLVILISLAVGFYFGYSNAFIPGCELRLSSSECQNLIIKIKFIEGISRGMQGALVVTILALIVNHITKQKS